MLKNLRSVFDRLKGAGFKLKPKKCTLFAKKVNFLGHVVTAEGVATDPEKIKRIKDWPIPVDASELRSFLGLCGYYRRNIENFAKIAKWLHQLTEKGRKFLWTEECPEAFEDLKGKPTKAPIFAHPDLSRPFILDTDASNNAIGAVLSQKIDDFKNAEGQLARWLEVLSTYDMKIKHRSGSQYRNADALSRIPCRQCGYSSDWKAQQLVHTVSSKSDEFERDMKDDTEISLKHLQDNDKNLQIVRQWVQDGHKPNLKNLGE
ncbi:Retrovirus-related Pol polyprotein from transposon 297,Retrovirus-related Pol polyprotein from transposon 17.6,Retrovirus-related Pol polyprotein from transposon 412 [Mytilus coruscus]|uniref:Retrovirus-related Pol polyprotein from transposon 297,Retrovirus-related Pol polyprotein from transposon 17.6,Retrovirus-related Pol polyprotein from transposon 412 n=1 Tax=Mytilus coruscus TaxID=42192 RepID=A0A6J8B3Z3_MYTCO|nr:Retrovirus-related Pol polyprotein from transposon 297,Retrovirus-related Pol polyprotein from transposon 17.6,Retrovirus-related Pol polyprotein from transposon 412 [Mytilus coruscus]